MEKLTDGELKLMEVLWDLAPINSTQLVAACKERLSWSKSTTYTVLRRLAHKGAVENREATVTTKCTREEVLQDQGSELLTQAGGMLSLFNAFFNGRRLTPREAEELKELIDRHTWEE